MHCGQMHQHMLLEYLRTTYLSGPVGLESGLVGGGVSSCVVDKLDGEGELVFKVLFLRVVFCGDFL